MRKEDILKQIIEEAMRVTESKIFETEKTPKREFVGVLPSYLEEEFNSLRNERIRLDEDLQLRKMEIALRVKRELEEEFDKRFSNFYKRHHEAWNDCYHKMLIDPDDTYYHEEGKLYREIEEEETTRESTFSYDFTKPKF
jgi:hypothetical protein